MKIGFDISQTCESKSGTGFYADQMIRALAHVDNENEYTLLPWFYDYRPQTLDNATKINRENFEEKVLKRFSDEENAMKRLDIIHSNNFRFPKDVSAKKVVTLYDVCFLDHPEYTTEANRLFCYKGTLDSMLFADKIIAISEYTKKRLLYFFPFVDEKKVEVVYCGNRDTLLKEKDDESLIKRYGLKKDEYYLSVGTIEPRKNYTTLLQAYKIYKEKNRDYKKLCIAGGYGWMEENFKHRIVELGLTQDVVVTGYVTDAELSNLYRYCFGFVYPTWYEGFGLPVLEAMNFRKPVIASRVSSIPEITGDSAILVSPGECEEIVNGMLYLEASDERYSSIINKGYEQTRKFSWIKSANQLFDIYKQIILI
ncbi:MAG: glycosyltransferase family 4 protein [Clostridiales bacterium]|nr:glycosyltransferase family 4 protein [Clostridiales bacterium]